MQIYIANGCQDTIILLSQLEKKNFESSYTDILVTFPDFSKYLYHAHLNDQSDHSLFL